MTQSSIDVRCPYGPQKLFMKLLSYDSSEEDENIPDYLTIEFACSDCARFFRKEGQNVYRVLHRYTIVGKYKETEVVES